MNVAEMNELAQSGQGERQCGFCGRPWFGLVAYCPYCGRQPGATARARPLGERTQKPAPSKPNRTGSPLSFKTVAAGIGALLIIALLVLWFGVKPPAARTSPPAPAARQAPSMPPRAEIAAPPPPANRSLCSAANEAAGLCKSQQ